MKDGKYRIIIVDDEKDVLEALHETLKRAKEFQCEVEMANEGSGALALMEKGRFDLIITDYKMPGMNGIDLLVAVKEKYPGMVRILITGFSDVNVAREAMMKAQVLDYIEKPWDNTHLRATVLDALKDAPKQ
jgi:two-component system probable response regulator PhcQ